MNDVTEQVEHITGPLTASDKNAVLRLTRAAEHVDHVAALSEQPLLWLADPQAQVTHLAVRAADDFAGYAQVDLGAPGAASAELVVHPLARRHGVGTALLDTVRTVSTGRALSVWAHGDLPAARELATRAGLAVVRELWSMGLDLTTHPVPTPDLPAGVHVRTFVVGQDEDAWLAQNAAAFAHHPEQGRLTRHDIDARIAEDWFDPHGFWLIERDGELQGSVWTKVVGAVGEIYVVGVHPTAQGQGLGRVLTLIALEGLASRGLTEVVLYVDADNTAAVHTYRTTGFERRTVSVQYGMPTSQEGR